MSVQVNYQAASQGAFSTEVQLRQTTGVGTGGTSYTPIPFNSTSTSLPSQVSVVTSPTSQSTRTGNPYGKATVSTGFYTATDVYVSTSSSDPTYLFNMIPDVEMSPIVLNTTQGISVDMVGNTGTPPLPNIDITIIFTIS